MKKLRIGMVAFAAMVGMAAMVGINGCDSREGNPPEGMTWIPGGNFSMGDSKSEGESDERPAHSVSVDGFYMDQTEVTKAQWDAVYTWAVTNGYSFDHAGSGKAPDHPVHTVSWFDVVKWCNARSEMEGRTPCYTVSGNPYKTGQSAPDCNFEANGYRLPTEAEWEYAARGGLHGKRFPWGDTIAHSQANYVSSSSYPYDISTTRDNHPSYDDGGTPYTSPVGSVSANGYGLYDMAGNVWEWCWDPSGSTTRGLRGGGWDGGASYAPCGYAGWSGPDDASYSYGLRAVCR